MSSVSKITQTMSNGIIFNKSLLPLKSEILHFYQCRNIVYRDNIIFHEANQVIFDGCDNNFIYYWFDQYKFPKCTNYYLFTHPNEPNVLRRAPNARIFLNSKIYMRCFGNIQLNSPNSNNFFSNVYPLSRKELKIKFILE
jgi:hypothetical protein